MAKAKDAVKKEVAKKDEKVTAAIVRRKPQGKTIARITTGTKKARKNLAEFPTTAVIESEAIKGVKLVAKLAGTKLHNDGKLSPLGHMSGAQNGLFDKAILTMQGDDFAGLIKAVARTNPASRKSDVDDNIALIKRLASHLRFISGRKGEGKVRDFAKRLKKVGLETKAEEIMNAFVPVSVWFEEYAHAGKF